jgi:hypothetical protein
MASRSSSIATAFTWAVAMAVGFGIDEGLINHEKSDRVARDAEHSALLAAVVAYNVKRGSPS